jgi:lysozyme family protein
MCDHLRNEIIREIVRVEGGYSNNPDDSGGETMYGVTEEVARAAGYEGAMINMPHSFAVQVYTYRYWDIVKADQLAQLSESVTREVVDTCVNVGPAQASKFLQRALNVLTPGDRIDQDGIIGPVTLTHLCQYLARRDERTLVVALNALQGEFYIGLAEQRVKDEAFVYGWLRNRVSM